MSNELREEILRVDPSEVLAANNSRFGLKPSRLESLKQSILDHGEITEPTEVTLIPDAKKGEPKYELVKGFYRHEAATQLNKEQNAGVLLPIRIKEIADSKVRLKRQLSENMDRENQSPMDMAVAIDKLLSEGIEKAEIRKLFSRPGRQKGATLIPASNAWVNIIHNLLQLPKTIQAKIHNGDVGVEAAYELGKVAPDKRAAILERAEAIVASQREREDKDEDAFLKQESKVAEVADEATKAQTELQTAEQAVVEAQNLIVARQDAYSEAKNAKFDLTDKKAMGEAVEKVKAAEADLKGAEKTLKDSLKKVDKLKGLVESKGGKAQELRAALEAKRKGKTAKGGKKVSAKTIKKAARDAGESAGTVPLNATEIRKVVDELASGAEAVPRVAVVGQILKKCFDGVTTPKMMLTELTAHIMGPKK